MLYPRVDAPPPLVSFRPSRSLPFARPELPAQPHMPTYAPRPGGMEPMPVAPMPVPPEPRARQADSVTERFPLRVGNPFQP